LLILPFIPNDFILNIAKGRPEFVPIINLPFGLVNGAKKLRRFIKLGAKGSKIHAAANGGDDLYDKHYKDLLEVAQSFNLPVVLHISCIHIRPIYKTQDLGHAEHFETWFKDFPKINFVLAHRNYHYPDTAISLCNRYDNVYTDNSWQPMDSIHKAISTCDNNKFLFGSDWPILVYNIYINAKRILDAKSKNNISSKNCDKILYQNAQQFLIFRSKFQ